MAESRGPSFWHKTIAGDVVVGALRNSPSTGGEVWAWGTVAALALDDAAITDYKSLTGIAGKSIFLRLQSALDGALAGGSMTTTTGAKSGAGLDGSLTWRAGLHYFEPQASATNTYLTLDSGTTVGTEARIDFGSSLTTGLVLSWSGVYGMKLDDAACAAYTSATGQPGKSVFIRLQSALDGALDGGGFNLQTGGKSGAGADGGITFDAGFLDLFDQGATATKNIRFDSALTTALTGTIATGAALTSGLELATAAGAIVLDSAAAITLEATTSARVDCSTLYVYPAAGTANQYLGIDVDTLDTEARIDLGSSLTTGLALSWAGVYGLKVDDAAITNYLASSGAGKDVHVRLQSAAAASGLAGASLNLYPGAGDGVGLPGRTYLWDAGGTKNLSAQHDGTDGYIRTSSGQLYLNPTGGYVYTYHLRGSPTNTYDIGFTTGTFRAGYYGEDRSTATACAVSGLYLGLAQESRLRWNRDATGFPAACLILGLAAVGSPAADVLALSGAAITGFANTTADTAGKTLYTATQGGGVAATTGKAGADWYVSLGAGSAAGGAGPSNGGAGASLIVTPGAGGLKAGAGTDGAAGALKVRVPGGSEDLSFSVSGTTGQIATSTGTINICPGNTYVVVLGHILPSANQAYDLGRGADYRWRTLFLGQDTTTGPVSTSGASWGGVLGESRLRYNKDATSYPANSFIFGVSNSGTASADRLALSGSAITGFTQTTAATAGNSLFAATQTGGVATTVGLAGADLNLALGAGSAAASGVSVGGAGGNLVVVPGAGGAGFGGGAAGAAGALIVRQPGGAAGTDDLCIKHDGNDAIYDNLSANRYHTFRYAGSDSASIGLGVLLYVQTTQYDNLLLRFGTDGDWGFKYDETTTDSLILSEGSVGALAIKGSAISSFAAASATAGNALFLALQDGGANAGAAGFSGASCTLTTGAGSASANGNAGDAGSWNFVGASGGNAVGGNGGAGGGFSVQLGAPGTGGTPLLGGKFSVTGAAEILGLTRTGAMTLTPGAAVIGLTVDQNSDMQAMFVDSESTTYTTCTLQGKYGFDVTQDISGGYAGYFLRNVAEAGSYPLLTVKCDHSSNTQPGIYVQQDGAGYGISLLQNKGAAAIYSDSQALAATPADGFVLTNSTAALVGAQVQMTPRFRIHGAAWNGTDSDTTDWAIDALPAAATPITSTLRFGHSLESAAYTYPMTLTNAGAATFLSTVTASGFSVGAAACYYAGGTDVAVADGGTGLSAWTVGDIVHATGATTLAGLADVATGAVLCSGGVGAIAAYSVSPSLTSLALTPTAALVGLTMTAALQTNTAGVIDVNCTAAGTGVVGIDVSMTTPAAGLGNLESMYGYNCVLVGDAQDNAGANVYGINFGWTANGGAAIATALNIPATFAYGLYTLAPTYLGNTTTVATGQDIRTGIVDDNYFTLSAVDNDTQGLVECIRLKGAAEPHALLERARFGTTVHAADAGHRGQLYMVEGGAGVADKMYCIMKGADDLYTAVQVCIG